MAVGAVGCYKQQAMTKEESEGESGRCLGCCALFSQLKSRREETDEADGGLWALGRGREKLIGIDAPKEPKPRHQSIMTFIGPIKASSEIKSTRN